MAAFKSPELLKMLTPKQGRGHPQSSLLRNPIVIRALVGDDCELETCSKGAIVFVTENLELQILHNSVGVQIMQTEPLYRQVINLQSYRHLL